MATPNRSSLLSKTHRVLKKHYKPVAPPVRPLLEHLLFACCLENSPYEKAEEAFQALTTGFFDYNEVRVSTVKELSEVIGVLPEPALAAANVKRVLYGVFESTYSFDLESLKKQNLGVAIKRIEKLEGATPFVVAYATQVSLGGHAIPLDRGAMESLQVIGVVNEAEAAKFAVPGMERAIPKNKGVEFGSLLHQLSAEMVASPYSPDLHKILLEIAPDAKDRLPKKQRAVKKKEPEPPPPPKKAPVVEKKPVREEKKDEKKPVAAKKPVKVAAPPLAKKKPAPVAMRKRKPR